MNRIEGYGGGGGGSQRTPVQAPDSLRSIAYFRILDLVSEGEIGGLVNGMQSVYLNDTPLANPDGSLNFQNAHVETRTGTQDQDYVPGYSAVENEISVGVELKSATPWVQAISNTQLSAVRITLSVPQLMATDTSNGDTNGYTIAYHVDVQTDGGAWTVAVYGAFDGKTTSKYQRSHRIDLPAATSGWNVRVVRTTPNQNSTSVADTTTVDSYTQIIDAKLRYPNSALVAISGDAQAFQNIPTRAYDIWGRLIRVPSNYDPHARTYSGVWDGSFVIAWSNNPAWVFLDLISHPRYGLGDRVIDAQIDKWALYTIARYCDEMVPDGNGGTEPRFTCNVFLQTASDAYKLIGDLASLFRGIAYWNGVTITASADMPGDPSYLYTNANVIDGKFSYASSPRSTRYTTALVTWNNPDNRYVQDVEYVPHDAGLLRYGIQPTDVVAFGCTSRGQAQRTGQWILQTAQNETDTATFSVGKDGMLAAPGQLIRVQDAARAGKRQGGRIHSATATAVTVDKAPDAVAVGDNLTCTLPSGITETHAITAINGAVLSVAAPGFGVAPNAEAGWVTESATLVAQQFRVVSVKEDKSTDKVSYTITAVQNAPGKYTTIDGSAYLPQLPISALPAAVQVPPANVTVTSQQIVVQGTSQPVVTIAWTPADGAQSYRVEWQRNSGGWISAGTTNGQSIDVYGAYTGSYIARVTAVSPRGVLSLPASSDATTIAGKTQPPDPPTITAQGGQLQIVLNWTWPTGVNVEDTNYTEVWVSPTSTMADGASVGAVAYPGTSYTISGLLPQQTRYAWVRLVDKSGNIGPWSAPANAVSGTAADLFKPLQDQIDAAQSDVNAALSDAAANTAAITAEASARAAAIAQEATDRANAITAQAQVDANNLAAEASARGAAITSEQNARQNADSSLSTRIDTNTSAIAGNTAAIQTEQTTRASADSAEANLRTQLATQLVGSYTGTDLTQVTSGLIAAEKNARVSQDNAIATQMALLSAGVGEQFDYVAMWYFTASAEGWVSTGSTAAGWTASWITTVSSTGDLYSPTGLALNGAEYAQVRFRVRKVGAPTWKGQFGWQPAAGGAFTFVANQPEPAWDANGIGVVMLDTGWGAVTVGRVFLELGTAPGTTTDHYEVDWVAIGRPAPGASSAALSTEATARATADTAEVTARQLLAVSLTGTQDASSVTSGLLYNEQQARIAADNAEVTARQALAATVASNTSAITTEQSARASGDSANAALITSVQSNAQANAGAIFRDDFTGTLSDRWVLASGTWAATSNQNTGSAATAGRVLVCGDVGCYLVGKQRAPFDPSKTYRVRFRTGSTVNAGLVDYIGFVGYDAAGNYVNTSGTNTVNSQFYGSFAAAPGTTYYAYAKGYGASVGTNPAASATESAAQAGACVMHPSVRFIAPVMLLNYQASAGPTQWVDFLELIEADGLSAALTAQAQVTSEATTRAAADSANASAISAVQARMPTGTGTLANAADVTSEASTRATADSALGTRIDSLTATVGGNTSAIVAEQSARASGDATNATAITGLQSSFGAMQASQPQVLYAMDTDPGETGGAGSAAIVAGVGTVGSNVLRCTGPASIDRGVSSALYKLPLINYDPGKLYRVRAGVKAQKAGAKVNFGITPLKADGTNVMGSSGEWYAAANGATLADTSYHTFEGWFTGNTGPASQPAAGSTASNPATAPTGTAKFALQALVNWGQDNTYVTDLDFISLDVYDLGTAQAVAANAAAITTEASTRATADSANATAISAVTARMPSGSGTVATQASVDAVQGQVNASYTLAVSVGNKVSGLVAQNNGTTSSLVFDFDSVGFVGAGGNASIANGKITLISNGYMKVQGVGFGVSNEFVDWYGPVMAVSQCSRSNAIYYLTNTGAAYFGGALNAGTIKNSVQSTDSSATASVILGPFTTNGGVKSIVASYSGSVAANVSGNAVATYNGKPFSGTAVVERSLNDGTWAQLQTLPASGVLSAEYFSDATPPYTQVLGSMGNSVTFNDGSAATSNMRLRMRVTAQSISSVPAFAQSMSIVETEG